MATHPNLDNPAAIRRTVADADPLSVLETEMALLQRALERLARRSDIHRDLDRASYLLARVLDALGPISVKDLASRVGLDATTVTSQGAAPQRPLVGAEPDSSRVAVSAHEGTTEPSTGSLGAPVAMACQARHSSLSRVMGRSRTRMPVAWCTALAIAAAVPTMPSS